MKTPRVCRYKKEKLPGLPWHRYLSIWLPTVPSILTAIVPFLLPLAIAAVIFWPSAPHIRIFYDYVQMGDRRLYTDCTYVGNQGLIHQTFDGECPLIVQLGERD